MPTYEYRCANEHTFEQFQRMSDPPVEACPQCGAAAERVLSGGAGLLFKGSGFYITDYRSDTYKKAAAADAGGSSAPAGDAGGGASSGGSGGDKGSGSKGAGGQSSGAKGSSDASSGSKGSGDKGSGSKGPSTSSGGSTT